MTGSLSFYFVDVFASEPLTGNPLALVPDADHVDESRMRAIAREFNQSETTFLLSPNLPELWRLARWLHACEQRDLSEPHWHIGPIAVEIGRQGQGLGTRSV